MQAGDAHPLGDGHRLHVEEQVLDIGAADSRFVHRLRWRFLPGEHHCRKVGKRPAGPNDLRSAPVARPDGGLERAANVLAQGLDFSTPAASVEKLFCQAQSAEWKGQQVLDDAVGR